MAPTITSATLPLVYNQEVSFGNIAGGPFDFIDVYVDIGANVIAEWRIYATVGGIQSLVATAQGGGEEPQILSWNVGGAGMPTTPGGPFSPGPQSAPYNPAKAAATAYELRAFLPSPIVSSVPPPAALASIVGYDQFDTAANTTAASTQVVPANFTRVVVATVPGYANSADVAVAIDTAVPVKITFWAVAGVGGVTAPVPNGSITIDQPSVLPKRLFSPNRLPGATSYFITAEFDSNQLMTAPSGPVNVTGSLGSQSTITAGAVVVNLTGNANGLSNNNHTEDFVTSTTDADVHVAAQAHPIGSIYEGLNGLTNNRNVFLNTTASGAIGDTTIVKDEDGSLAAFTITVNPGAGNTIDGNPTFVMNAAAPGPKGSNTFKRISATAWAVV
jgi:hypothetical protein